MPIRRRDISEEKDGSMVKEVKSKGSAYKKPNPEDEVVARITIRPRGSEEVVYENASAIFTVSEGFLMPAVGAAVRTMGLHECAVVQAASRHCFGSAGGLEGKVPADADLDIEIELKEMHPVDDLGCPGKIRRKILKQGDGYQTPGEMAPVRVRYTVKTADGAVLDDSHAAEGQEFAFVTGEDADGAVC